MSKSAILRRRCTRNRHVIVRANGPSLGTQSVANPLLDPTLELHDQDGTLISSNDNWRDMQSAEIIATGIPPTDDRESAIVMTLTPGNYTAIVRGGRHYNRRRPSRSLRHTMTRRPATFQPGCNRPRLFSFELDSTQAQMRCI